MKLVRHGNLTIEETALHIVNAPSQGAAQLVETSTLNRPVTVITESPRETLDVLMQFKNNLGTLEDLSSNLFHLMADVRSVIRR